MVQKRGRSARPTGSSTPSSRPTTPIAPPVATPIKATGAAKAYALFAEFKVSRDIALYSQIMLTLLECRNRPADSAEIARLAQLAGEAVYTEISISTLAFATIWRWEPNYPQLYPNLWQCCQWSGKGSKYSIIPAKDQNGLTLRLQTQSTTPDAFIFLQMGNAMRELGLLEASRHFYRQGLLLEPENPFLTGRLAILQLLTHHEPSAHQLMRSLRSRYPEGRETLFLTGADLPSPPWFQWSLPPIATERETVILAAADPEYFRRYVVDLVRSLTYYDKNKKYHFHFHIVRRPRDARPEETIQQLLALEASISMTEAMLPDNLPTNSLRAVYASARFLLLPEVLRTFNKTVLCIDIDLLALRSLDELLLSSREGDLALIANPSHRIEPWESYWATMMVIQPSPRTISYFQVAKRHVDGTIQWHPSPWFNDQAALYVACRAHPEVRVIALGNDVMLDKGDAETIPPFAYFFTRHGSWDQGTGGRVPLVDRLLQQYTGG